MSDQVPPPGPNFFMNRTVFPIIFIIYSHEKKYLKFFKISISNIVCKKVQIYFKI